MEYNRQVTICAAGSRRAAKWPPQVLWLSELYDRLKAPARGKETLEQYKAMPKAQQDDLKDVGGFVAGMLSEGRRKASAVEGRDLLTLDLDKIPAGGTDDILRRVEGLGCGYCAYSTRKHAPEAPRLRVLVPLDRTITADEYEPIARKLAALIGMEFCDPSTFEASRLMYWPSCCADSQYVYLAGDKPLLSADGMLALYQDWRDIIEWPQAPGAAQAQQRLAAKQADPTSKPGVVGAFCRIYDIHRAIADLIPTEYAAVDNSAGRYTYTGGSTTGGAVVYDNGAFLFSHHATDPAGGKLCNAFDLVRLHMFGDMDDDAQPGTPANRLPSYTAMCEYAVADSQVSALMARERFEEATRDFEGVAADSSEDPANWMAKLEVSATTNRPAKTIDNLWLILENDPNLKGKFAYNEFASRVEIFGKLPWSSDEKRRYWEDVDNSGVYWYMEKVYQITGQSKIDDALRLHRNAHKFNEVRDYLEGLKWDGVRRLDTLFIDYLGAEDNVYTRAATRKAFTAAAARAMQPGIKFDCMPILAGPQGIGKSTLLRIMSTGKFNDSICTFEGKDASEVIQGVWIVEISEMDAFRRTEASRVKQFLSLQVDRFRAAYGREVKDCPRCCVFFGTTNSRDFLRDRTGNRRFWPVDVGVNPSTKNVWKDLEKEVGQFWAEAVWYWRLGEPLFLTGEAEQAAKEAQEEHREQSPYEGIIADFLERQVPEDWDKWNLDQRMNFWNGIVKGDQPLTERRKVCAIEVWCEALGKDRRFITNRDAAEINAIIDQIPGWERMKNVAAFGCHNKQRGFIKVATNLATNLATS